jgi:N-acetylglucosaminyl-diphospho-decaprenol L-rhamnosyltransferase
VAVCLDSLAEAGVDRVLVVDNGSDDGTAELLAGRAGIEVLRTSVNLGFAGGAALGLDALRDADLVLLLNDDAQVLPGAVEALLAAAARPDAQRVAAFTAQVLLPPDEHGVQRINSTGNVLLRDGRGADRDWLALPAEASTEPDVFGFCGAAALLRRTALEDVGSLEPGFFLYYEDTDLSWRMRLRGWQIRYVPEARVLHEHAQSSGVGSPVFLFYNWRNQLLCLTRNAPAWLVLREVARSVGKSLLSPVASPKTAAIRRRALLGYLRMLPATLGQRRDIGRRSVLSRRDVAALRLGK